MQVGKSAYYDWSQRPTKVISAETLHLYRQAKTLFKASWENLSIRELVKKLRKEGIAIGRYRMRTVMRKLKLKVKQGIAYKVTTKRKHSDQMADNLLNRNLNPMAPNEVWAGDITYLRAAEGWMYLAVVMDLYSCRIVGWHIYKRKTVDLIGQAMD
ncbi:MAG: putative transposase [Urechidicola sp.]|jgi:putative transposase